MKRTRVCCAAFPGVGFARCGHCPPYGFWFALERSRGGHLRINTLLPPKSGWILMSATGISDAGQIVGYGINPSGKYSGYELTPVGNVVPEPSVLAFFGTVCAGMAVRAAARRGKERLSQP